MKIDQGSYRGSGSGEGYVTVASYDPVCDVAIVLSASIQNAGEMCGYYDFIF